MDKETEKRIMDDKVLIEQENVILQRKSENEENSYTCYLFKSGLDKILKKVGEECTETVIAAKNLGAGTGDVTELKKQLVGEVSDLLYHLQVMLCDVDVSITDVLSDIEERSHKTGNKKIMKKVDKNT